MDGTVFVNLVEIKNNFGQKIIKYFLYFLK